MEKIVSEILVSVIVPVYNLEKYIGECLNSLIAQTFTNFEVIVVNDGSTDGSSKIINEYKDLFKRYHIIEQENKGLSEARNAGIKVASGKYIMFLDGDDFFKPDTIEILSGIMESEKLDVLRYSAFQFDDAKPYDYIWSNFKYKDAYEKICTGLELLKRIRDNGDLYDPTSPMAIYSKSFLERHGLKFYPNILGEDNLFFFYTMTRAERCRILNKPFYCARKRKGSITSNPDCKKWLESLCVILVKEDAEINANQDYFTSCDFLMRSILSQIIYYLEICKSSNDKLDDGFVNDVISRSGLIAKKYNYFDNRNFKLFYTHQRLYRFYHFVGRIIKSH